jgi:hypothetical protein
MKINAMIILDLVCPSAAQKAKAAAGPPTLHVPCVGRGGIHTVASVAALLHSAACCYMYMYVFSNPQAAAGLY